MSTYYLTPPMSMEEFYQAAEAIGWQKATNSYGGPALSNGWSYAHYLVEFKANDGETRVMFSRYGGSNVDDLAEELGAVSEHDNRYAELADSALYSWDDYWLAESEYAGDADDVFPWSVDWDEVGRFMGEMDEEALVQNEGGLWEFHDMAGEVYGEWTSRAEGAREMCHKVWDGPYDMLRDLGKLTGE